MIRSLNTIIHKYKEEMLPDSFSLEAEFLLPLLIILIELSTALWKTMTMGLWLQQAWLPLSFHSNQPLHPLVQQHMPNPWDCRCDFRVPHVFLLHCNHYQSHSCLCHSLLSFMTCLVTNRTGEFALVVGAIFSHLEGHSFCTFFSLVVFSTCSSCMILE